MLTGTDQGRGRDYSSMVIIVPLEIIVPLKKGARLLSNENFSIQQTHTVIQVPLIKW